MLSEKVVEKLWSLEGEAGVLGSMLIDPACIAKIFSILDAESFYKPEHQLIFKAIDALSEANKPVDAIALRTELIEAGQLEVIGGVEYIGELMQTVPHAANAEYYARVVKDKVKFRQLVKAVDDMKDVLEEPLNPDEQIQKVRDMALDVEPVKVGDGCFDVKDYATEIARAIQEQAETIQTGFTAINRLIGGFSSGEIIIIAGRTSMGKTALALDFALKAAQAGRKVVYFTLEVPYKDLMERAECNLGRIDMQAVKAPEPAQELLDRLYEAAFELEKLPLIIYERSNTPEKIIASIKTQKKIKGVDLVIIDYLQLMNAGRKSENRQQEITTISRKLKLAAIQEQVPIIALSQLNREVESRTGHRPRLSDLRESGSIEQDADVVMLLHREDYYRRNETPDSYEKDGSTEVIVAKNRRGSTGIAQLVFLEEYVCFGDVMRF